MACGQQGVGGLQELTLLELWLAEVRTRVGSSAAVVELCDEDLEEVEGDSFAWGGGME